MMNLVPVILGLMMCGGGAFLLVLFAQRLRLRFSMARWPRMRGIVRGHRIHSQRNVHGPGHHRLIVIVECSSAGRKWIVHCDSPTRQGFATEQAARSRMDTSAIGESVEIYLDPRNDRRAFLRLPEISALLMLGLGSVFLLAVGAGILSGSQFWR